MWKKAKTLVKTESSQAFEVNSGTNLEGADPELCITLFQRGLNFSSLKTRLKTADQKWMEGFLEQGGLSAIFDALQALADKVSTIADALRQLDCVACIKAVMNSQVGLDFIINFPEQKYVRKLSEELDSANKLVKVQVFELLSALCLYSEEGHTLALDALNNYKKTKGQPHKFSKLIQEIHSSETDEYTSCILAFVNCLIASTDDISDRIRLRNELIGKGVYYDNYFILL
jgi:hypothetical protein